MNFFAELRARGLVEQTSDPEIADALAGGAITAYCGFDPSASSLHVGSLLPVLGLLRLQRAGHRPIAVVGGATGLIGDPSGKSQERLLLPPDRIAENLEGLRGQLRRFLAFEGPAAAKVVNNADWFAGVGYLDFLRDVGKHFSVNAMIAKESVRARLVEREQGISYTEFSYMLVQAYDFLWLFEHEGCRLQIGGSDQWGNITAGIDLIRRKCQQTAYGYTQPLITKADGSKFGKSETGNVWLDPARTSPYQLFQFLLNTADQDVAKLLRFFTMLPLAEIDEICRLGAEDAARRGPQRALAREVTTLVHGADETAKAERAAATLFTARGPGGASRDAAALRLAAEGAPSSLVARSALEGEGLPLASLLSSEAVKLSSSSNAARRDIAGGGVYVNEERVTDPARRLIAGDLVDGDFVLLRKGRRSYHLIRVATDATDGGPQRA